jgi:hypothetical protein
VSVLWSEAKAKFKSPWRVVPWFLWRSRETKARKCRRLKRELDEAQETMARQDGEIQRQGEEICRLKEHTTTVPRRPRSRPASADNSCRQSANRRFSFACRKPLPGRHLGRPRRLRTARRRKNPRAALDTN